MVGWDFRSTSVTTGWEAYSRRKVAEQSLNTVLQALRCRMRRFDWPANAFVVDKGILRGSRGCWVFAGMGAHMLGANVYAMAWTVRFLCGCCLMDGPDFDWACLSCGLFLGFWTRQ